MALSPWVIPRWEIALFFSLFFLVMTIIFSLTSSPYLIFEQSQKLFFFKTKKKNIILLFRGTFQNVLKVRTTGCIYFWSLLKSRILSPIITQVAPVIAVQVSVSELFVGSSFQSAILGVCGTVRRWDLKATVSPVRWWFLLLQFSQDALGHRKLCNQGASLGTPLTATGRSCNPMKAQDTQLQDDVPRCLCSITAPMSSACLVV